MGIRAILRASTKISKNKYVKYPVIKIKCNVHFLILDVVVDWKQTHLLEEWL